MDSVRDSNMNTDRLREVGRPLLKRVRRLVRPAVWGTLRRTQPLSNDFGFDRGTSVDRFYIERFLAEHREDVRGRVLEVKEPIYTTRFGTGVERSDVLDIDPGNARATFVADLSSGDGLPGDCFDCFILTQTLQLIYQIDAAVRQAHRVLRTGGVLLVSVPSVSRLAYPPEVAPDYWRFTAAACTELFGDVFGVEAVTVRAHGNVLTCIAFLTGMALEELRPSELAAHDPLFPLVVTVRAVKR
jgi:SAM-dependent methyltransferase